MSEDQAVQEPAEQVVDTQGEANEPVESQPESSQGNRSDPNERQYEITLEDGNIVSVGEREFKYLANLGVRALQRTQQGEQQVSETAEKPEAVEPAASEDFKKLQDKVSKLEADLTKSQQDALATKIQGEVSGLVSRSDLFQGLSEKQQKAETQAIYNSMLQEGLTAKQAVKQREEYLSELLGEDRKKYIQNKLRKGKQAQEPAGGGMRGPEKPFTRSDLDNGKVAQATIEMLRASRQS